MVAELLRIAVGFGVVLIDAGTFFVHPLGVPFRLKRRHAVNTPMGINTELGIQQPFGRLVLQRFPRRLHRRGFLGRTHQSRHND